MFKFLPDVKITWGDVGIGAVITALLFTIGKTLLSLYLSNSSVGSTYGAAGSFVVLLLWVNYSAQILLFGAEFTQVYANKYGSQIVPAKNAIPLTEKARVQQGIPHNKHLEKTIAQKENKSTSTVEKSPPQSPNQRRTIHPAAVVLATLIGVYQSFTKPRRAKDIRKNRTK
jgi:membrane protein